MKNDAMTDTAYTASAAATPGPASPSPSRLKFGGAKHSAPFPNAIVVFRPNPAANARPLPAIRYSSNKQLEPSTENDMTPENTVNEYRPASQKETKHD